MPSQLQLLEQMVLVLDTLVANATELNNLAKKVSTEGEFAPYQKRQHEIFRELSAIDELLQASPEGASKEALASVRQKIHEKLELFQKINEEFLLHVSSHFRLINQDKLK